MSTRMPPVTDPDQRTGFVLWPFPTDIHLPFISVCDHRLDPMNVCTEASQLHLLTLARFDRERVRVNPLISGDVGGFLCVGEDVENGGFVNNGEKCHRRDNLFEDVSNFCLDL